MLKIVTYNVNGIRSAISKGFLDWLRDGAFDVVCLQEVKARPEDIRSDVFEELGYHVYWHAAVKKGYSGVATLAKRRADHSASGCSIERYDNEGRILRTDFGDWTILNCYFPSGTMGDVRQSFKMEFLDDFFQWAVELRRTRPYLIVVGDYNIAHNELDIHNPKSNKNSTGFLPEERAWMSKWLSNGFTDAFRHKNPDGVEYSWWSFRPGVRSRNLGWRIDYHCVSDELCPKVESVRHLRDVVHSDHCPVLMEIDL
jgi:exodeoxyribonuclease-3